MNWSQNKLSIEQKWNSDSKMPSGFDYMRVGLAISVLLWHSCQISYGSAFAFSIWRSPAGLVLQLILPMFFSLSGFLVTASLDRSQRLWEFLLLRVIRIYPALTVEVLLSAFVLGPLITKSTLPEYFVSLQFYKYILNVTGYIHFMLPGVFLNNPLPGIVNTSLWTVPFELECYAILSVLVVAGYMRSHVVAFASFGISTILLLIWMTLNHQSGIFDGSVHGRILVLCFLAGSILYRFRHFVPYDARIAAVAFVLSIVLFRNNGFVFFGPMFAAYFTVWLGLRNPRRTVLISHGDYSYGTYLYAGPIQQSVVTLLGTSNSYLLNIFMALPLTVCFALFSWHSIEKPFLRVKKYIRRGGRDRAEPKHHKGEPDGPLNISSSPATRVRHLSTRS